MEKGHYGKYTGNARCCMDHADTKVTKENYKASERGGETGGYNYSDEKVVKLLDKAKKLKNKKSSKSYGEDTRVSMSFERPDSDSMLNMNSPLNQGGYVGGGMSASDYAPVGDLYMNMFNSISSAAREYDENKNDPEVQAQAKAMKAQRLGKRMDKIDKKFADPNYNYDDGMALDDKRRKLAKKQAEALVDQTEFENIANRNKDNQFDKLFAIMSKEDKEKYGLTTDTTT